jgi:transcription-repair coupling factor (superfamily II helicase)
LPARETPLEPRCGARISPPLPLRFPAISPSRRSTATSAQGIAPGGIEFFLPLFFERTSHLFEYLPPASVLIDVHDAARLGRRVCGTASSSATSSCVTTAIGRFWILRSCTCRPRNSARSSRRGRACSCAPSSGRRKRRGRCRILRACAGSRCASIRAPNSRPRELAAHLAASPMRVLLAAESAGAASCCSICCAAAAFRRRSSRISRASSASDLKLGITVSAAVSGLRLESPPLEILTEAQLFGDRARQERRRRRAERDPAKILKELSDLRIGAPVVHESYGVGRYVGCKTMDVAGYTGEFLVLEYADGDKLYVPVQALHLVSRYTGAPAETAPLHKLGGEQWQKARRKAAQRIRDVAAELLDLYSRRAAREGTSHAAAKPNTAPFKRVSLRGNRRPGRRHRAGAHDLEVRQADGPGHLRRRRFRQDRSGAARGLRRGAGGQAGRRAGADHLARPAALHHLRDRFADWPVRIESLSRFRTNKEADAVIAGIAAGTVDIVIATQRLLQGKVRFKDLGLVVIDEEHRFGVRDKEKLKALRAEVDVLTLTATPIPRTSTWRWAACAICR